MSTERGHVTTSVNQREDPTSSQTWGAELARRGVGRTVGDHECLRRHRGDPGSDSDGADVAAADVAAADAGGVVVGGVVVGGVVVGDVVVGDAGVDVGAGGDVDGLDEGDDVEVDGAREVADDRRWVAPATAVVTPGVAWASAPPGSAEVVGLGEVAVVLADDARTSATVDVGATTGAFPPTAGGCTAGPESPAGAWSPGPGSMELRGESGVESSARAAGGATHGRRSPGRTGPPRRPTARTAT
jgi:hypothetical protein